MGPRHDRRRRLADPLATRQGAGPRVSGFSGPARPATAAARPAPAGEALPRWLTAWRLLRSGELVLPAQALGLASRRLGGRAADPGGRRPAPRGSTVSAWPCRPDALEALALPRRRARRRRPSSVKTWNFSQFRSSPPHLRLVDAAVNASRFRLRPSTIPAFSWKIPSAWPPGRARLVHGIATRTSRMPAARDFRQARQARGRRGRPGPARRPVAGELAPRPPSRNSSATLLDRLDLATASSVHPTTRRIRPPFRTSPSIPRMARNSADAVGSRSSGRSTWHTGARARRTTP